MLGQSYISKKEKLMPPCKAAKARLTLLFGGSSSGDMKRKPLSVYHSENPRALKNKARGSLPIVWKGTVTPKLELQRRFSRTGFFHHFVLEVEKYCSEKHIPFNILLLLDNAWVTTTNPQFMDNFHPRIKVVHSSFIQPMDREL